MLLHNRLGLRIEFRVEEIGRLTLWFSPGAGQSSDYRDRNFSNRDDHASVFDHIHFPELDQANYVGCDYDPFHTVIRFADHSLHLLPHFTEPAVILWTTEIQAVDFKSDRHDDLLEQTFESFAVAHRDRWHQFEFVARVATGRSRFVHQRLSDTGRSHYARARLRPSEPLVIIAGIQGEGVGRKAARLASQSIAKLLKSSETAVDKAFLTGNIVVRDRPDWQRLHALARRHLLSARDASGAVRAGLDRAEYLIRIRDGAFIENSLAVAGWSHGSNAWSRFVLANPTEVEDPQCSGQAFLALVNQLTKLEEDGLFYAVWSAFTSWTQHGTAPTSAGLEVLEAATGWLERYCFDGQRGLFGRGYADGKPCFGSRDYGYDNEVGNPVDTPPPVSGGGKRVLLSYDLYINECAFSTYCMLAAMLPPGDSASRYLRQAQALQSRLADWFATELPPPYGMLLLEDGNHEQAPPYGIDPTGYIRALTVPPFASHPHRLRHIRERLLRESSRLSPDQHLQTCFSLLGGLDNWSCDEESLLAAIDHGVARFNPVGNRPKTFHPPSFVAGTFLSCLGDQLLRRLPFGLAVRGSGAIDKLKSYAYRGRLIDVHNHCAKAGPGFIVRMNGKLLRHSLQLPEEDFPARRIRLELHPDEGAPERPLLISSTISLRSVGEPTLGTVRYQIDGYGWNDLQFHGIGYGFELVSEAAFPKDPTIAVIEEDGQTHVNFWGRGSYELRVADDQTSKSTRKRRTAR